MVSILDNDYKDKAIMKYIPKSKQAAISSCWRD